MTTVLHLGVIDVPYRNPPGKHSGAARTTGDVATILESKYGLMGTFWKLHSDECIENLVVSVLGSLETAHMRGFTDSEADPNAAGIAKIEDRFKNFILSGEAERVGIPGTPTKAALRGVSHRFKHPYAKRNARVSFYDTGLYVDSFKAWIDE